MEYQPVVAGPIVGHEAKIDGQHVLLIEGQGGGALGMLREKPNEQRSGRRDPKTLGTVLEAADGSWFIPNVESFNQKHRAVLDSAGTEVAGVDHASTSRRELHVPAGDLAWERHMGRPQYRIDGLFGVSRGAMHTFVAGISKHPFNGEITDALAQRSDASLVLLLACWLTTGSISSKVAANATSG